jgi:hypothetical protein
MKVFTFLLSACLLPVLVALVACDSAQPTQRVGTIAPAATASTVDYARTAPPFEVIAETELSVMACDRESISTPQIQAVNDYGRTLEGKIVQGRGWVVSVEPDEKLLKQLNELDNYNYDISLLTVIDTSGIGEPINVPLTVDVTRQQAEQFVLWHDPAKGPPYEEVQFGGTIGNALYDTTFHSLMIAVAASTATRGTDLGVPSSMSQQSRRDIATNSPCPSTKGTNSVGTATPVAATVSEDDKKPAPPFEVISATMKHILGRTIPIPEQQLQALAGFSRSLRGKSITWQGWVETVWPDEGYLQQHNKLNTYEGGIDVYIYMDNPNSQTDNKPVGSVVIESVPLQQAEQLAQWHRPLMVPPYEKVQFTGTIELAWDDPTSAQLLISVISPTVTLAK